MTTDMTPNVRLVRRHYEDVVNHGDLAAVERDLADDFVDHAAPPGTPPGPASVKEWIVTIRGGFPDLHVTEEHLVAESDRVGVLARWEGTHDGEFLGIAATGRAVAIRGVVLWRIEGGRLAERWSVLETSALLAAIT